VTLTHYRQPGRRGHGRSGDAEATLSAWGMMKSRFAMMKSMAAGRRTTLVTVSVAPRENASGKRTSLPDPYKAQLLSIDTGERIDLA
jgi:hypothetical protein